MDYSSGQEFITNLRLIKNTGAHFGPFGSNKDRFSNFCNIGKEQNTFGKKFEIFNKQDKECQEVEVLLSEDWQNFMIGLFFVRFSLRKYENVTNFT